MIVCNRWSRFILPVLFSFAVVQTAQATEPECQTIRFVYSDSENFPYAAGQGAAIPASPGAGIDLVKELAASYHCELTLSRLPTKRAHAYVMEGMQDATIISGLEPDIGEKLALPRNETHALDNARSVKVGIYVYVLKKDLQAADADTKTWLANRTVGVGVGSRYGELFRRMGSKVEQNDATLQSGLNKLLAGRIDAVASIGPKFDTYLAAHPEIPIERIEKPILQVRAFLAFSPEYYSAHRNLVESIWKTIATSGQKRFEELVRQYQASETD